LGGFVDVPKVFGDQEWRSGRRSAGNEREQADQARLSYAVIVAVPPTARRTENLAAVILGSPFFLQRTPSPPARRSPRSEFNFCNNPTWTTLPASRFLTAAVFRAEVSSLASAPHDGSKTSSEQ
jgi:hypothetical protein